MKRTLIVLVAMLMAAPAFAQGQGPASSPAQTLAGQPTLASAAGLNLSPAALKDAVGGQTINQPEWQRQYDRAKARKTRGVRLFLIGVGVGITGSVMAVNGEGCSGYGQVCHPNQNLSDIGGVLTIAAQVPLWWGLIDWIGGANRVRSLETLKLLAGPSQTVALTEHQSLQISLGPKTGVGYQLAW
jgi:hypothetical protein